MQPGDQMLRHDMIPGMGRRKDSRQAKRNISSGGISEKTKRAVLVVFFVTAGCFLLLAAFNTAGTAGAHTYTFVTYLVGVGYFLLPLVFFTLAGTLLKEERPGINVIKLLAGILFVFSGLSFIDIVIGRGGVIGDFLGHFAEHYFATYASLVLLGGVCLVSILILLEGTLPAGPFISLGKKVVQLCSFLWSHVYKTRSNYVLDTEDSISNSQEDASLEQETTPFNEDFLSSAQVQQKSVENVSAIKDSTRLKSLLGTYAPPPLSLLEHDRGKPGVGDVKANANIIKRTLQNFGIVVELDEISIGPSVTRYAIKPAESVRLQKIVALQNNLELALAAHPVRIEAPIPGKSLVGIEVPNQTKMIVGLGTLLESPEFSESHKSLLVALGRDIAGGSHFANLSRMPHILIAGATGSGKSVTIHTLINSLLFRCGPQQLRFLMIDPKRVELTLYNHIPHLLSPVITDAKKAILALKWAGREMGRRYDILETEHVRDIESYHQNILAPSLERLRNKKTSDDSDVPEAMPYIVIVIDELADIMQTFPRELEAAVVRLAQMSRAVGIHLLLSTQRPSVNVITGLIKANIPSRIALQVASQVDSRTILDQSGAEKLLGAGDMLYLSGDMSKPIRLQSAFISENEVKKVVDFIAKHNDASLPIDITPPVNTGSGLQSHSEGNFFGESTENDDVDDDLYEAAYMAVLEAGKASTSYLQRKLRIGYARAARLMDILEERGVIGSQDGAKPRAVLDKKIGSAIANPE